MSDPDDRRDERLDSLLRPGAGPDDFAPLRERVFAQTIGVIRFRRRLKRCALLVSLVSCYLAGMATMGFLGHAYGGRSPSSAEQVVASRSPSAPDVLPSSLPGPGGSSERQTGSAERSREESLRRSADRCLLDRGDVKLAIRRYERALRLASADQRAILPEQDSWLLMALKDAKSKEMKNDLLEQN